MSFWYYVSGKKKRISSLLDITMALYSLSLKYEETMKAQLEPDGKWFRKV